ncbi:type II toxin-antitoxin system RelE/ParE family toxin [Nocardioides sp.]|uniref:type II toxin-antitoxin system RelE family toxin n=1 Tax=Nocardioides sp. TaxID=35761 RepID=UPI0035194D21
MRNLHRSGRVQDGRTVPGSYAARRGEFRVIYTIHEDRIAVRVISIRHRRDAYA